jgi:hypothetical protein
MGARVSRLLDAVKSSDEEVDRALGEAWARVIAAAKENERRVHREAWVDGFMAGRMSCNPRPPVGRPQAVEAYERAMDGRT